MKYLEITSLETAKLSAEAALGRKAEDVVILDLREITSFTDFFMICTGNSSRHLEGIADAILGKLEESKIEPWHIEGERDANWILQDYVDVVVHLFLRDTREFYGLERLWADAPHVELPEVAEVEYDEEFDELEEFFDEFE